MQMKFYKTYSYALHIGHAVYVRPTRFEPLLLILEQLFRPRSQGPWTNLFAAQHKKVLEFFFNQSFYFLVVVAAGKKTEWAFYIFPHQEIPNKLIPN